MKKIISITILLIAVFGINTFAQKSNFKIIKEKKNNEDILLGYCIRTDLIGFTFKQYFDLFYKSYTPDSQASRAIAAMMAITMGAMISTDFRSRAILEFINRIWERHISLPG